MARWLRAIVLFAIGLAALALLWGARYSYGDFLPLRGYQPLHAHLMAPQEGLFLGLYIVLGAIAALGLGLAMNTVVRRPITDGLRRLEGRLSARAWVLLLALLSFALSLFVGFVLLEEAFLTDDEMAMLFQARTFLLGRLWAEPTSQVDVFHYAMIVESPRWYGIYPPGHPLVMALSILVSGDPRPLIAVMSAGWVVATYFLARRFFDTSTALLAAALLSLSPFFVLTSGSMASELTSGFFLLIAVNAAVRLDGRRSLLLAVVIGGAVGAAYCARPYTALIFSFPLGLWIAWRWFRRELPLGVPFVGAAAALPFIVAYLWINSELTGSAWVTPYAINFPGRFRLGFGQDTFGVIHTPQLALAVMGLTLVELNVWSLGWPLSLIPIIAGVWLGPLRRGAWLLAAIPLFALVAHMPVPMAGVHDTGPLYYLEVLPLLVILAARGLIALGRRLGASGDGRAGELVGWVALAAFVVSVLVFWQQQVDVLRSLSRFNNEPYVTAEETIEGRALVFVDEIQTTPPSSWVLGVRPPHPDLRDRLVFGHVVNQRRAAEVLQELPGRRAYFLSRDQRTGDVSLVPLPMPVEP